MAEPLKDGQFSFEGGQDSSVPATRLPENKYHAGVNVTTKEGLLSPRYGFDKKYLNIPKGGYSYKDYNIADFDRVFYSGKFQAVEPYAIGDKNYIIIVISGIIYAVSVKTFEVIILTLNKDTQVNEESDFINCEPAGRFLVIHDDPSFPIILDGLSARRSDRSDNELPVSNLGVYNQSRYFFSNKGNEFSGGDPVGNQITPNAPITVKEIELPGSPYLQAIYQMPSKFNSAITAMTTLPPIDKSTGIGALIVAGKNEIWSYDTTIQRDHWGVPSWGTILSDKLGIAGPRSYVPMGSDLFFISNDGNLRSLSSARDEQRKWSSVSMNEEVRKWVSYRSQDLIKFSTVAYFRNKIIWTTRPFRVQATRLNGSPILDVAHSGFLVMELDNMSRLGQESPPTWAGLWTGIRPMGMCVIGERMFVMSKDKKSRNTLYEVMPENTYDTDNGKKRKIRGRIYTKEHYFNNPASLKSLSKINLGLDNLQGEVKIDVAWKPSHSKKFTSVNTFQHNVKVEHKVLSSGDIQEKLPLSFREIEFGVLEDFDNNHPATKDMLGVLKGVQLRIDIEGDNWQLKDYQVIANAFQRQNETEFLEDLAEETEEAVVNTDWEYKEFK